MLFCFDPFSLSLISLLALSGTRLTCHTPEDSKLKRMLKEKEAWEKRQMLVYEERLVLKVTL